MNDAATPPGFVRASKLWTRPRRTCTLCGRQSLAETVAGPMCRQHLEQYRANREAQR